MSAIYDPLIRCGTLVATKLNYGRISGGPYQRARSGGLDAIENHAPLALASGQPEDLPVYMYIWRSCPGIPLKTGLMHDPETSHAIFSRSAKGYTRSFRNTVPVSFGDLCIAFERMCMQCQWASLGMW